MTVAVEKELKKKNQLLRMAYDKCLGNLEDLVCLSLDTGIITQSRAGELLGYLTAQQVSMWHRWRHATPLGVNIIPRTTEMKRGDVDE